MSSVEYSFYQKVAYGSDRREVLQQDQSAGVQRQDACRRSSTRPLGHQLVAGQSLPLGSFAEGEWRLEIKVTDKISGKTITHNVKFIVTA